jgi:serine/threonine-protein kinase
MTPEKLGSYRIDSEIGRGGMGVVYRATHVASDRTVAIKVLPAELARDGGFADRFAREIAALQKLDHRNIVKLIEPGEDQGYQYYVMEFVQGRSLDKVITAERRLPWQRAVELAIQMCHGLKHAHDHGIIHRDLKPANLLITDDGTVKLTDFGIAKVFAGTAITVTGGIIGTPEYMSPEQGDGRPITKRSDLYSLGVVLYAMLTGRAPFLGRSMAELVNLHRFGQFDRPSAIVPEIPSWLDELVCQLLEKDPEKRPPDAHVVSRRLEVVQKKVAMRSAQTLVEGEPTVAADDFVPRRRRGTGPATLMQRLMRAQLRELDQPGWLGSLFQKTWVLVALLLISVGALTIFALSSGEGRRWSAIQKLAEGGDERDLGLLLGRLQDYLRRYENGPHADEARAMLPDVERERRRREFVRSPLVGQMRPNPEPPSELERQYRKALLQLWLETDDAAARATLETIATQADVDERDQFLLRLAEEDLLSLRLRHADQLRANGQIANSRAALDEIVEKYGGAVRYRRWVKLAQEALAALPTDSDSVNADDRAN